MSYTCKSITESRLVVARDLKKGKWEMPANGYDFLFWDNENILELDSSNGCPIL
jgi:hypothetical protein